MTFNSNDTHPIDPHGTFRVAERSKMGMWLAGLVAIAVVLGVVSWTMFGPGTNTASKSAVETIGSATPLDFPMQRRDIPSSPAQPN